MKAKAHSPHAFQVVGLTGPKGSGKDTVAQLLAVHAGFQPIAFADALRAEICAAFQVDESMLLHRETKELPLRALALSRCLDDAFVARMVALHQQRGDELRLDEARSPRSIMVWWGTEYRRAQHNAYWLRPVVRRVCEAHSAGLAHRFVLSDVRFADEAALVREFGGLIWRITRPGCDVPAGAHVSETTGAGYSPDTVIDNLYDVRHLQQQVLTAWGGFDLQRIAGRKLVVAS